MVMMEWVGTGPMDSDHHRAAGASPWQEGAGLGRAAPGGWNGPGDP